MVTTFPAMPKRNGRQPVLFYNIINKSMKKIAYAGNRLSYAVARKIFLCMKLTAFFLLIALQVSSKNFAQDKISLNVRNVTVIEAFHSIEKVSNYRFSYSNDVVPADKRISLHVQDADINLVLTKVLNNIPLTWSISKDKNVVLFPVDNLGNVVTAPLDLIKGIVRNEKNEPVEGASVIVKGTSSGTVTNNDGSFSINAKHGAVLVISRVGYKPVEVTISDASPLSIVLVRTDSKLDEIVVVGYGTQTKSKLTTSISSLSGKEFEKRPVTNASQALQGSAPGLIATTNSASGEPGAGLNLQIRGMGTLHSGGGSPLVLVDGIEQNINQINPNDIDNISVLKDAASTAIYGARAPFGVVLITTKSGKSGRFSINYNNNFAIGRPTIVPHMMKGPDFMAYWNAANINDGNSAIYDQNIIDSAKLFLQDPVKYPGIRPGGIWDANGWTTYLDGYASTDWFKEIYRPSFKQMHNLSFSGGDNKTQYYLSGGLHKEKGLLSDLIPDSYDRYNVTAKLASQITPWLRFTVNNRLISDGRESSIENKYLFYHNIARRWPNMGAKDLYGNWNYWSEIPVLQSGTTKYGGLENSTQFGLNLSLTKNLVVSSDINFLWWNAKKHSVQLTQKLHMADNSIQYQDPAGTYYGIDNEGKYYFSPNVYATYNFNHLLPSNHNLKLLVGYQQEYQHYKADGQQKTHLLSENLPSITNAIGVLTGYDNQVQWASQSGFGRLNYDYAGKYMIEFDGRYSGSSRFPDTARWIFTPGVSVGWDMAKENFFRDIVSPNIINYFKLRFSWGASANQLTVPEYGYISMMGIAAPYNGWLFGGVRQPGVYAPPPQTPGYTWEKPVTKDFGIEASMFRNRLDLNFDIYSRTTFNVLGPSSQLPALAGTSAPNVNNSDIRTKGFELSLGWHDKISNDISYNAKFLLADNKTKVLRYYNPTGSLNTYYEGQDIGSIWGYTSAGLFRDAADVTSWTAKNDQSFFGGGTWMPGDVKYVDVNGDGKVNNGKNTFSDHGDLSIIGNSTPRYQYSFNYGITWKFITLSMFWQGIGKRDLYLTGPYMFGVSGGMWQSAAFVNHADYWRTDNQEAYYARPTFNNSGRNQVAQTRYLQNAAYLRLKNVTVNFAVPQPIAGKIGASAINVFVTGENLWTKTKIAKAFDPETVSGWDWGKVYPLSRIVSGGLSITF